MKWATGIIMGCKVLITISGGKYKNKKVKYGDEPIFDSIKEFSEWIKVKRVEQANAGISNVRRQVTYELFPRTTLEHGCIMPKTSYIADIVYWDDVKEGDIVVDVKGVKTQLFKRKAKWFFQRYKKNIVCI